MKKYFEIVETNSKWKYLLQFGFKNSNIFQVAYKSNSIFTFMRNKNIAQYLEPIYEYCIEKNTSKIRWNNRQIFYTTFLTYKLNEAVFQFINTLPLLEDWNEVANKPEDPSFFNNDIPILQTISHEKYALITINEDEIDSFKKNGFELRLMSE